MDLAPQPACSTGLWAAPRAPSRGEAFVDGLVGYLYQFLAFTLNIFLLNLFHKLPPTAMLVS